MSSYFQTNSFEELSGEVSIYTVEGDFVLREDLIFSNDSVYTPILTLRKGEFFRLIAVFYYDDLPIGVLDTRITVTSEDRQTIDLSDERVITSYNQISEVGLSASAQNDVIAGILPDLDLDDDGYSNNIERRAGSDPRDANDIPAGPVFGLIRVEGESDGNEIIVQVVVEDGNGIETITANFEDASYLRDGGLFTETITGDTIYRKEYELRFDARYAPVGNQVLTITASNDLSLTTSTEQEIEIVDNGDDVGPVIVFENLETDQVVSGAIEVFIAAYDRSGVQSLDVTVPSNLNDRDNQDDETDRYRTVWRTTDQANGSQRLVAVSEDENGNETESSVIVTIDNGPNGTGPSVTLSVRRDSDALAVNADQVDILYGIVRIRVDAFDGDGIEQMDLVNLGDFGCDTINFDDCKFTQSSDGFVSDSGIFINFLDVTDYEDGDEISLIFNADDNDTGNTVAGFDFTIRNTPYLNWISGVPSSENLLDGTTDQVTISWSVESFASEVKLFTVDSDGDNDGNNPEVICLDSDTAPDGYCTFVPSETQRYVLRWCYQPDNRNGTQVYFCDSQRTEMIYIDHDQDGIVDEEDNCKYTQNGAEQDNQADQDGDGIGDACDPDKDGDGYVQEGENQGEFDWSLLSEYREDSEFTAQGFSSDDYPLYDVNHLDCNDTDAFVYPNQEERLYSEDANCDGSQEFDFSDSSQWNLFTANTFDENHVVGFRSSEERFFYGLSSTSLDWNDDGNLDLVVVAIVVADDSYRGKAFVYLGDDTPSNNFTTRLHENVGADIIINGTEAVGVNNSNNITSDRIKVVASGDFNGDGVDDLVIGAPGSSNDGVSLRGRVSVLWGGSHVDDYMANTTNNSNTTWINMDDFEQGNANFNIEQSHSMHFYGDSAGYMLGTSLDIGDLDGNGEKDELVIGAAGYPGDVTGIDNGYSYSAWDGNNLYRGHVYFLWGPEQGEECASNCQYELGSSGTSGQAISVDKLDGTTGDSNIQGVFVKGAVGGDNLGSSVKIVGDVDGEDSANSSPEIAVSAHGYSTNSQTHAGAVYLFEASDLSNYLTAENEITVLKLVDGNYYKYIITGATGDENFGSHAAPSSVTERNSQTIASGHFDEDDKIDLLIGEPSYNDNDSTTGDGIVYLFKGSVFSSGTNSYDTSDASKIFTSLAPMDDGFEWHQLGSTVITCDLNQNGADEVIIGASRYNSMQGAVLIFDGDDIASLVSSNVNQITPEDSLLQLYGASEQSRFGESLHCLDYNDDGWIDLLIGSPEYDDYLTNGGLMQIIRNDFGLSSDS